MLKDAWNIRNLRLYLVLIRKEDDAGCHLSLVVAC